MTKQDWVYWVDKDDNILGKITFKEAHEGKEKIHRASHIFIFTSKGELVLQKRGNTMRNYPGAWESSASGHVEYGEDYLVCAQRELEEEIGINTELKEFGKFLIHDKDQTEMVTFFIGHSDGPFRPDKQEVQEVRVFSINEIKELMNNDGKFTKCFSVGFEAFVEKN